MVENSVMKLVITIILLTQDTRVKEEAMKWKNFLGTNNITLFE